MYLAVKQQLNNLSKEDYLILKELSHISKNLYNQALYEYRQAFFEKRSQEVSYYTNDKFLRGTENYSQLQAKVSQQILMSVDEAMKSFWKKIKQDPKTRLPKYLDKDVAIFNKELRNKVFGSDNFYNLYIRSIQSIMSAEVMEETNLNQDMCLIYKK